MRLDNDGPSQHPSRRTQRGKEEEGQFPSSGAVYKLLPHLIISAVFVSAEEPSHPAWPSRRKRLSSPSCASAAAAHRGSRGRAHSGAPCVSGVSPPFYVSMVLQAAQSAACILQHTTLFGHKSLQYQAGNLNVMQGSLKPVFCGGIPRTSLFKRPLQFSLMRN